MGNVEKDISSSASCLVGIVLKFHICLSFHWDVLHKLFDSKLEHAVAVRRVHHSEAFSSKNFPRRRLYRSNGHSRCGGMGSGGVCLMQFSQLSVAAFKSRTLPDMQPNIAKKYGP